MDNQTKKILDLLEEIDKTKKSFISELNLVQINQSGLPYIRYDKDATQYDKVNSALLADINKAAELSGVIPTITTASTGHPDQGTNKSRHGKFTAVDIAILDGSGANGATNSSNGSSRFRELGNRLKDALVSLGYRLNSEKGNEKAVLWQTNIGGNHYNHLHVSNNSGLESTIVTPSQSIFSNMGTYNSDLSDTSSTTDSSVDSSVQKKTPEKEDPLLSYLGKKFFSNIFKNESVIKEQVSYDQFGKNCETRFGQIHCPAYSNKKVLSPIDGKIKTKNYDSSCKNMISIEFMVDKTPHYIKYCGISDPQIKEGKSVSKGDVIGKTDSDFTISFHDDSGDKEYFDKELFKRKDEKSFKKNTGSIDKTTESDPLVAFMGKMFAKPFGILGDKYDETGKRIQKRWASPIDPVQPDPWFQQMSPTYKKKVQENIEKIKKIIK